MNKIHILPEHVVNLIAAGEVVERPMNVIKELLENAIDAKATEITIELVEGGLTSIKVRDNGEGMSKEDLRLALKPHSTSKIQYEGDLFNIKTLGFRGEALPSIKAISDFTIESNNTDSSLGYYYHFNNNELEHEGSSVLNRGTIVTVKNLFHNTPARLKHLKTASSELNQIIDYLYKSSLGNPSIKITLYNNQKLIYQTLGNGDLPELIGLTYGMHVARNMQEISGQTSLYSFSGYVSNQQIYRNNKKGNVERFVLYNFKAWTKSIARTS